MGTATQARTRLAHRSETRVRTESGQSEHHRDDVHGLDTGQTRGDHEHRDVERHGGGAAKDREALASSKAGRRFSIAISPQARSAANSPIRVEGDRCHKT